MAVVMAVSVARGRSMGNKLIDSGANMLLNYPAFGNGPGNSFRNIPMKENFSLDSVSLRILQELQRDARQTAADRRAGGPVEHAVLEAHQGHGGGRRHSRATARWVDPRPRGAGADGAVEINLGQHSEDLVRQFERRLQSRHAADRALPVHHRPGRLHPDGAGARHRRVRAVPARTLFKLPWASRTCARRSC